MKSGKLVDFNKRKKIWGVSGTLRMDIDIALVLCCFMSTARFLVFSYWAFKEPYFDHYMFTFAIEIVFGTCRKYVMS